MFTQPNSRFATRLHSVDITQSFHLSPEYAISYPHYQHTSSEISNKQKDCLLDSTDEQQSTIGAPQIIQQISIYGEIFEINFHKQDSINSFLDEIERKQNINRMTKLSIKIIVLERAVSWKKQLRNLLNNTYEAYQKMRLKSIMN